MSEAGSNGPNPEFKHSPGAPKDLISRRGVVIGGGAALGLSVGFGVNKLPFIQEADRQILEPTIEPKNDVIVAPDPIPTEQVTTNTELDAQNETPPPLFEDPGVEEMAKDLELTPERFFRPTETIDNKFSPCLLSDREDVYTIENLDELLPFAHPDVYEHKDLIYQLAIEFQLPPNAIALLMSIESGGDKNAGSAYATGLFQLRPEYHLTDVPEDEYNDPLINGRHAMPYFKRCLDSARDYLETNNPKEYPKHHPDIYLRALAMYNAGQDGGKLPYKQLSNESQLYMAHAKNGLFTIALQQKMREAGMTNEEIIRHSVSTDVNARAKALPDDISVEDQEKVLKYLGNSALEVTGDPLLTKVRNDYLSAKKTYANGGEVFDYTLLNPYLRTHSMIQNGFIYNDEVNRNKANYTNIDTTLPFS